MSSIPIRVWAPNARSVGVVVEGNTLPLSAEPDGWWVHSPGLPAGTDYAFMLDGDGPYPDPRSAHQPHGVHGPSRTFDPTQHAWQDADWPGIDVRGAVIYELHVGTFTPEGTLDSAIERLDHLADTGVDIIELMPVAAFPGTRGWGYDGVALYAVHDTYGGPAALQRFVDAAHARGLGVALDVVDNHLGPTGNYLALFGPYFTDAHHTPWGSAVNLDQPGSEHVRSFLIDKAVRWFRDFHLDALRLDAVHELRDDSPTHVLAQLASTTAALAAELGRPLGLIAESDLNDVTMVTPVSEGGLGMTAQWDDDVHHAIHAFLTGERHGYYTDFGSLETLVAALQQVFVHNGTYSSFRHKVWGAPVPDTVDRRHFVIATSTHDQVGNRGLGDRPPERLTAGQSAIAAALLLTTPFTPMLFMGEEWASRTPFQFFTDFDDPDLAQAVREGRAREFGEHGWDEIYGPGAEAPDPQAATTFERSRLDWDEHTRPEHARHLAWVKALIALRRLRPDLRGGDATSLRVSADPTAGWLILHREHTDVVINTAAHTQQVTLPEPGPRVVLASWEPRDHGVDDGAIDLAAHDVVILGRD
ncbi:malto-oligosyltrehalose trehalohydrolase [Pseudactinotalea terrae]|uniref:malto-oligosyltrehalose trehalohydrolase n=1 Tax=Pseudactinotalea terrae TaxID=1743262 RepID=UPI0012E15B8A|nr:malto-oligosyltrehalose trehalohydrolase [Pseudactinotalea terrae]